MTLKCGTRKSPTRSTIFSSYQRSSRRKNAIKSIEVKILNTGAVKEAEKHTVFAARLTQRGHEIHSMDDLLMLYEKAYTENTLERIVSLPHPTVQKFAVITVAVVGASRRFLSQITRHQNEVKFMSASLQYSNYEGNAEFVIPYEILTASQDVQDMYMKSCQSDMDSYSKKLSVGYGQLLKAGSVGYRQRRCGLRYAAGLTKYPDYIRDSVSVETHDRSARLPAQYR